MFGGSREGLDICFVQVATVNYGLNKELRDPSGDRRLRVNSMGLIILRPFAFQES
jgi:hypothetical protein